MSLIQRKQMRQSCLAFTLIELLVVVAVILILSGMAFRLKKNVDAKSADAKRQQIMEDLNSAIASYYAANGIYPPGDLAVIGTCQYAQPPVPYYGSFTNNINGILFDFSITNTYPTATDNATYMGLMYFLCFDPQAQKWTNTYLASYVNFESVPDSTVYNAGPTPANSVTNKFAVWTRSYPITYVCGSNNNYQSYTLTWQ